MRRFLFMLMSLLLLQWFSFAGNYTAEQQDAYNYAYSQKITTISSIEKADMNGSLTRIAMAKMISNFAMNVLWLQPDMSRNCTFLDVSHSLDSDYSYWVTQACQLWLMWIWNDWKKSDIFNPNWIVTRAQFATAFSRALSKARWNNIEDGNPYYSTHLLYLQSEWIINNINKPAPSMEEKRWNVMIMMMRAASDKNYNESNQIKWNSEYYYENLEITASIWMDWKVDVLENFMANFKVNKHGIIRVIPLSNINIDAINVEWKKFTTYTENGSVNIKIWDADKFVKWIQNYPISYKIDWLIKNNKNSGNPELYWNLVWYDFDTNINNVKAEIILPRIYTWFTNEDFSITTDWTSKSVSQFKWKIDRSRWDRIIIICDKWLSAYEWITLSIKFPKDYFNPDSTLVQDDSPSKTFPIMSSEDISKLKDKWVIRWPKDAKITIVEFTELLCPYCQRQSNNWVIDSIIQQYSGQVNSISRPFIIHWYEATQLSSAMECVAYLKSWVYYDVLDDAFAAYPVNMTGLVDIAVKKWVDEKSLQECIDEWRYDQFVEDMVKLWSTLWVNWTPTSIIIDNETWRYAFVIGAYPIETFIETIESLLN